MNNKRTLTLISGIIDAVVGVALFAVALRLYWVIENGFKDSNIAIIFVIIILAAMAVLLGICGILFAIYGTIFIIFAVKQSKNLNRRKKTLLVFAIIEYVVAGLILISIPFTLSAAPPLLIVGVVIAVTATLKLLDSKKIKRELESQKLNPTNTQNNIDNSNPTENSSISESDIKINQ